MKSAYEVLKERGFIEQVTDEALIKELFAEPEKLPAISVLIPQPPVCISAASCPLWLWRTCNYMEINPSRLSVAGQA